MKAVAIRPGTKNSARVIELEAPVPGPGEVRVRVLGVGICGTDLELDQGIYGEAPPGSDRLVIGHESIGRVESLGPELGSHAPAVGDLVVALVRRPDDCVHCRRGEPDMCVGGRYTERGIKGRDGYMAEYYVERPEYLVPLPSGLRDSGVLLEPLSVVEKGLRHAWAIQGRMRAWEPLKALVLGAGPVGLLAALLLRLKGLETFVYSRRPRGVPKRMVEALGGVSVAREDGAGDVAVTMDRLPGLHGPFDVVLEATGSAVVAMDAMKIIGPDGVLCLASVTSGESPLEICPECLNQDLVLHNKAIFGTVNAHRLDFESGVRHLQEAAERWPGWAEGMITRRVPLADFRSAFERGPDDVKVVVEP